jgi:hypothetical protein
VFEYRVEIDLRGITLTAWAELDLPDTMGNLSPEARHNAILEAESWIENYLGLYSITYHAETVRVYLMLGGEQVELEAPIAYTLTDKGVSAAR